ncbi:aldose reductase [Vairimorpha necatrix]|uniref:Aldose reductase n=1 Tax=Vairimorpha necatrix TaxID=6039 RepID=A0AAX4J860_9MICR
MFEKKIKLNSGYEMPVVGLGTWMITDKDKIETSVRSAIKCGYRHIDTAFIYGNEKYIGETLKKIFDEGLIKREELFITSKLWCTYHDNPEKCLQKTLDDLQLDYIDLYLVHFPVKFKTNNNFESSTDDKGNNVLDKFDCIGLWQKMEKLVEKGMTKSIGVANYGEYNLGKILKECKIKPAINQFELHPYLTQESLVDFCHKNNINVVSYSSLGGTDKKKYNLKEDKEIINLSKKYNKSVSQILLSYLISRNILVIPKSISEQHIKENGDLFELSQEDVKHISGLNKNFRFIDLPEHGPDRFK